MADDTPVAQARRCLEEQKKNYDRLRAGMEAQLRAIESGDDPGLREEVDAISAGIARARVLEESLAEAWSRLSGPARDELMAGSADLLEEIRAALEKILQLEDACGEGLRERQARLGRSIAGLRQGKTLLNAYSGPRPGGGRFSGNV